MRPWTATIIAVAALGGEASAHSLIHTVAPDSLNNPDFGVVLDCEEYRSTMTFEVTADIDTTRSGVYGELFVADAARAVVAWYPARDGRAWRFSVQESVLPQTVFTITFWADGMPSFTQWRFEVGALFARSFRAVDVPPEPEDAPVDSVSLGMREARQREGVPGHWDLRLGPGTSAP